tara:strand:- start:241 stop:936 length:696 start_codon:yes stop_codon:yes gene_type:complete
MNENIEKDNLFKTLQKKIESNLKIISILVFLIIVIIASIQLYFFYENKKILKTSIQYNQVKSIKSDSNFYASIDNLSKEKNFFGILATLEKIMVKLQQNNIESAYDDYINLLNKNNLSNLYKSAIAVHGSYNLLDKLSNKETISIINESKVFNILEKIENLISFIDPALENYQIFILEINFLSLITKSEISNDDSINNELKNLYEEISQSNTLPTSFKERAKIIYEFKIYK